MPNHLTLARMVDAVRKRDISPVELTEAHLKQIERHNPQLNAFVVVLAEQARRRARELEGLPANGPLHGVPVTVKDSFDVAGLPTYCGSRLRLQHRATSDSTAAARLKAAGAVIVGKTNCPEFLMNYETDNGITGRTNNPWDLSRTPGGSSGGESAAISSFCSAGGVGSDGGGSVRVPAHFCGIAGLTPTPGRCPATGHYPEIAHPGGLLGVGGPMARTAADVRLLFQVLAGHDPLDPFSAPVAFREPKLDGLRAGVMEQVPGVGVDGAIRDAVRTAAAKLEEIGVPVESYEAPILGRALELWEFFFVRLSSTVMREILEEMADQLHWSGRELWDGIADQPEPSGRDVLENLVTRDKLRNRLLRDMERYRVLLWPACGIAAFRHRERRWETAGGSIDYLQAMMPAAPANALGLPAMTIPFGKTAAGLPVGIQLIGRPWEEELLLEAAVRLEEARGAFPGPEGY